MQIPLAKKVCFCFLATVVLIFPVYGRATDATTTFNVRNYGATGYKSDNAQNAIQSAIDACAKAGGGRVYLPPGEYTSGTLHLRSHVRFYIESGATLYASLEPGAFSKAPNTSALLYGEDLDDISIEGHGTIEGQAEYEWLPVQPEELKSEYGFLPASKMFNVVQEIERRALPPGVTIDWSKVPYFGHITYNYAVAGAVAKAKGEPLMRSYPQGWPTDPDNPHMIQLIRCKDVRITGLSILHSRSWTIRPVNCERVVIDGVYIATSLKYGVWADGIDPDGCKDVRITGLSILHSRSWTIRPVNCERVVIDGVYIATSLKYGVWADGIDPDGCKDVRISNCTIATGDDSIVFYSMNWYGPARPCENITVTNCRLSSASAAIKFCDGNMNSVRNVTIDNCVITDSNRGIAFMVSDGGYVDNVVLSNLVINTHKFDWFWWGDGDPIHFMIERRSEMMGIPDKPGEPPAGSIRNVIIRNVIAHGQGSCLITGYPTSWLDNVSLENIRLFISTDPAMPYDKSVNAMQFRYARNLKVKNVQVNWEKPAWVNWRSALYFEDVDGLELSGFSGEPAKPGTEVPAVVLDKVTEAIIRDARPRAGTSLFLQVKGAKSGRIYLFGNELHAVNTPYQLATGVKPTAVKASNNF